MSGIPIVRSNISRCTHWLRALRWACVASVIMCAVLLFASVATSSVTHSDGVLAVRTWMLQVGLPLLGLAMAGSTFALRRATSVCESVDLLRLRERLYFVAAVAAMVLLPSAILGLRWASASRPGNGMAIHVVEALALLIVTLLLWRNVFDARDVQAQVDEPTDRSISSIR